MVLLHREGNMAIAQTLNPSLYFSEGFFIYKPKIKQNAKINSTETISF
jgi:hypothetical protein